MKCNIRGEKTEEKEERWREEEGRGNERRLRGEKGKKGEKRICSSFIFP